MRTNVENAMFISPTEAPNTIEYEKKEKERKLKEENRKRFLKDNANNKKMDIMIKKNQRNQED